MSPSSPPPPPLPPPTVPSRADLNHLPPPPAKRKTTSDAVVEKTSAPPFSTVASSLAPSLAAHRDQASDTRQSTADSDLPTKRTRSSRCCAAVRYTPHDLSEPARSLWVPTRVLLLFRLAAAAILLGHLVFFSLHKDFSYREYNTWNYVGLTAAFMLTLTCSLLDVLRDEDADHDDHIADNPGEGMVTDVERQPVGRPTQPDPKLARFLTRFAVPLYQIFVTATLFGAVLYWAAIYDSSVRSVSYPLLMLAAAAPALALADFVLSMSMRFRLVYVVLYIIYNGLYALALWLFDKLEGIQVYVFLDPSVQSRSEFIAKSAGVAAASILAAVIMYALSLIPLMSCCGARREKMLAKSKEKSSEDSSEEAPTASSVDSSERTPSKTRNRVDKVESEFCVVEGDEDDIDLLSTTPDKRDRQSLSVDLKGMRASASGKWRRSSSGRLGLSDSRSSLGEDDRRGSFARSDSARQSTWQRLEPPSAKKEDEYFAMPAVDGNREVVKLTSPPPRSDSSKSLTGSLLPRSGSGRLSRSGSDRMSRSGSGRMSRSGSGRISRSGSGRPIPRASSGTDFTRFQPAKQD